MTNGARVKDDLSYRFLLDLSRSLDVEQAMKGAGASKSQVQRILKEAATVFKEKVEQPGGGGILHLYTDGASRGNPGQGGAGVVIMNERGEVVKRIGRYLGVTTNNVAEYRALILALESASEMGSHRVKIFSDSELMVRQIKGEYGVKSKGLIPLYRKACSLLKGFEIYDIAHIERSKNTEADKLANIAIDKAKVRK